MADSFETTDGTQAGVDETPVTENLANALCGENDAGKDPESNTENRDSKAPGVPEQYQLKIPDGHIVNQPLMTEFTELARESGLTNERAQK